jgi:ribosomal protein S18 acetylase RimI-like enzyme
MITIREARFPEDEDAVRAIDTGFATDAVFRAEITDAGVSIAREVLEHPLAKVFPLDDLGQGQPGDLALVAEDARRIVGFAACEFHAWNRRLAVTHIYVQPAFRQKGVGRQLLERIGEHARGLEAAEVWIEVSNVNAPGLAAYERLGFKLSGLDLTLYAGTPARDEFAFFLSKPVSG